MTPGDVLYIPKGFWYCSVNLEYTCSVGFWFKINEQSKTPI